MWLDALANGHCTPETFLDAMRSQIRTDREDGWEVLSLLDQYYRRGRIKPEIFQTLKSRLENSVLRGDEDAAKAPPAPAPITAARRQDVAADITMPVRAPSQPIPSHPAPSHPAPSHPAPSQHATSQHAAPQPQPPPAEARTVPGDPAVGVVLRDRYALRALIGRGSMGTMFEAQDLYRVDLPSATQRVALKVLHSAVAQREAVLWELQREFQHLQLLSHPAIVRVHEFDRDGATAFFTMELLDGGLLSHVFRARQSQPLPRPYALAIMRDVGAALAYAHSRGVVHGDVNPRNIAITKTGELRILDFGTSQRASTGTSGYASCQVLEGQRADVRDDVFSFACLACTLLSGQHPFPERNAIEASAERIRPRRPPDLTSRQWHVLQEGLRWDREKRPSDLGAWLARFDLSNAADRLPVLVELVNMRPPPRRPAKLLWAAGTAAVLLAAGYWLWTNNRDLFAGVFSRRPAAASEPAAAAPAPTDQFSPSMTEPAAPRVTPPASAAPAPMPTAPSPAPPPVPRQAQSPAPPPAPASGSRAIASQAIPAASARAASSSDARHPAHVELAADTVEVAAGDTAAHVVVLRRKGSLRGDAEFKWWTESGTAKPEQDFAPIKPRVANVSDGSSSTVLSIPVSGSRRDQPKSFYVVIDSTDSGAPVGARTVTMVTLLPQD